MAFKKVFPITGTTPSSATTAIVGSNVGGLTAFDWFTIDADLVGATGGTLDVYLQRKVDTNVWADWVHFPQLAAGASAVRYTIPSGADKTIVPVGVGTDALPGTPALATNTFVGGHPGEALRCVAVAGASTSAGAAITIRITGWYGDK